MVKKIKLMFVIHSFQTGGTEKIFMQLLNHVDRLRFEPILLIGRMEGQFIDQLPKDIQIIELGGTRSRTVIFKILRPLWKIQPDIILCGANLSVAVAIIKPFLPKKIRVVHRLSNPIKIYLSEVKKRSWRQYWIQKLGCYLACRRADFLITQCDYMKQDVIKFIHFPEERIVNIPNFVMLTKPVIKNKNSTDIALVSVGTLKQQKGYSLLIEAMKIVIMKISWVKLTIIGDGEEREKLEQQIKQYGLTQHIKLLGYSDTPLEEIEKADIFISSSVFEGFSNAMLEALALGKPVIATDCPGPTRELIQPGKNGWIAPNQDANGLAKTILIALDQFRTLNTTVIQEDTLLKFHMNTVIKQYNEALYSFAETRGAK